MDEHSPLIYDFIASRELIRSQFVGHDPDALYRPTVNCER